MPPKKDKNVQEKEKRRRPKNGKKILLSETEENINIQDINLTFLNEDDDQQKNRVVRVKKNDIKIMLANEVVEKQFKKKSLLKDPTDSIVLKKMNEPQGKINMKTKKVLKRKITLKNNKNVSINIEGEPAAKRGRPRNKKLEDMLVVKEKCDSTEPVNETVPEISRTETDKSVRCRRKKTVAKQDLVENIVTTEENTEPTKPKTLRRKVLNGNIKGPRTRKKANDNAKLSQFEVITIEDDTSQRDTVENGKKQVIPDVRRNSLASMSELSWTKDITSSSTTTCVTVDSNDFFRIDKKIPVVMLTSVDHKLISEENNNFSKVVPTETMAVQNDDTNKEIDLETNDNCIDEVDFPCPESPNLSSSSSESCSDRKKSVQSVSTAFNKLSYNLEKLSSKLKNFDLEIINWIGYIDDATNPNIEKIQEKLYRDNFLKDEMNIITHCQNIRRILSENNQSSETPENVKTDDNITKTDRENETHKNVTLPKSHDSKDNEFNISKDSLKNISNVTVQRKTPKEMDIVQNKSADNHNVTTDEDDEDDALSLYAESITYIEPTSRNSTSHEIGEHSKEIEEYIPEPIVKNKKILQSITYNPTKIINDVQVSASGDDPVIVCEKQSADSTSAYKEQDNDNNQDTNILKVKSNDFEDVSRKENGITKMGPQNPYLMSSIYKAAVGVESVVFKGVCFYNLLSKCKKNGCSFSHMPVEIDNVKMKLKVHSETTLVQEYMLIRNWSGLRKKYGMCFIVEFVRRDLTRMVVETALDFIVRDKIDALIIDIVEYVLLYLNKVDLCSIEDLLTFNIIAREQLLCDFFISTIAQSQNFSRFKSVFINLTNLMYRLGRSFSEDVAGHVLERVVILPYDEGLARALINIIKNTNISIYSNSMVGHLEQQLRSSNIILYDEFIALKNQASSQSALDSSYTDDGRSQLDNDLRCSPDTTNLDNMNKSSVETQFTRTIDINKTLFSNVNVADLNKDKRFTNKKFRNWRGRNSYGNTRNVPRKTSMRPPLRPPFKRRLDQKFDGSPSKYQRRNGSKFYNDFS